MNQHKQTLTKLSELGEFQLIDRLTGSFQPRHSSTIKGPGDDAAVMEYNEADYLVMTTDILTEGIHFDLVYSPLKHIGYKAVITNISDIYAMNAIPQQMTVSVAVSGKFSVEALDALYNGIYTACENYEVDMVGGDTTSSLTGLNISITILGRVRKENIVYRHTAKPNDIICVTGDLGAPYMGLQILEREKKIYEESGGHQPDLSNSQYLIERILKPEAPKNAIGILDQYGIQPSSMIDISDGLSSEILHICKASQLGCKLFKDKIPIAQETGDTAAEFNLEPIIPALHGGDEYELLFTISPNDYDKLKDLEGVTMIGHMTDAEKGTYVVTEQGTFIEIEAQGWNAMDEEEEAEEGDESNNEE